jgi:hypothetical protein
VMMVPDKASRVLRHLCHPKLVATIELTKMARNNVL